MRRPVRVLLIVAPAILILAGVAVLIVQTLGATDATPSPLATESASPTHSPDDTHSGGPASLPPVPTPDVTASLQPEPVPEGPAIVTIVNWGADGTGVYASGIVTGLAGAGGVCTLTATSSTGQTITGQVEAHATPAAVNCGVVQIPAPSGTWALVLGFHSDIAQASSDAMEVVRP